MGTRNLTVVIKKAKPVVAQYGQWDGYPSGQGATVLNFLKSTDLATFEKKLEKVHFINEDDQLNINLFMESIGSKDGWMNSEQAEKYKAAYPYLSRDHGAEVLKLIMDAPEKESIILNDSTAFAADSLYCEWAYIINLDTRQLEVYGWDNPEAGFENTFEKLAKDPEYQKSFAEAVSSNDGYGIVQAVKSYAFDNLPEEKDFIKECEGIEE